MNFVAGEPLPPGFEDEMSRTAVITKAIESHKGGALIGTEYAVELHGGGQVRPDYFCVLCNTCNDSRSIFIHWTSVPHRTNYLKTHFQKAFELLQQLRRASGNSNELLVNGTNKLVQSIEKHFGRSTQIMVAASDDFRRSRAKICSQVRDKFHYDECAGPDFVDEVRQMLADSKPAESNKSSPNVSKSTAADSSTITLDAISSDDDSFSTATGQQKQATPPNKKARKKQEEQQPAYRAINRSPPGPGADKNAKPAVSAGAKQQLPSPKELSMQASQIAQERYRWEKFRCLLEIQLKLLRDETETYESNPEKHPDYSEEWKLFWNRRYKQLQEEKKCDPNSYDYKPEWISYWKDRRVELFNIAVNKIKKELKEKFKLGDEDEEKTKELMERYKIRISSPKKATDSAAGASSVSSSTNAAVRRKPNYRGSNHRAGGGGAEAVIDISDDEHEQAPAAPSARPSRRPPYGRSISRSLSPKRGRREVSSRLGRRSRSRSPLGGRRRLNTRSRSRSSHRRSSRSPYSRVRDRSHHSRGHDDYLDRDREKERARERSSGDYYRDRGESYTRSSRAYEPMETFRVLDSRSYPEYSQPGVKRSSSPTSTSAVAASKEVEHTEEPEGPLTVVSVLRMLSALEDQLGSLGPKALNLLSKALAMEKVKPNAAEDLLLNEDNCVFLETTKEKLKGILIAEVLEDPQKVRVVKKLITNIATIIFQASTKNIEKSLPTEPKLNELTKKEYQLPYDRQLVSSKLASALIKNGVDNVNTEDMNRLMHFFTLLAKTHHQRRQTDRTSGLNFAEVPIRMGLEQTTKATNDDSTNSSSAANPDINIDLAELIKEVESQLAAKESSNSATAAKAASNASDTSSHGMESLTDSDLQTLLQNFKFLSNEEQVHLIGHLRKLEKLDPQRVEQLRKYVKVAEISSDGELCSDYLSRVVAINRPGANNSERAERTSGIANARVGSASVSNATGATGSAMRRMSPERDQSSPAKLQRRGAVRSSPNFMLDDDDDDDYNFDDLVMKANDSNGKKSVMMGGNNNNNNINNAMTVQTANKTTANPLTFKPAATKISLKDTENIIASLMGTLTSNSNQATSAAAKAQAQKQQLQQQQQQQQQQHPQLQQQQHPQQRNLPSLMQNRQQQPQQQQQQGGFVPNNGGNNYYNYGNDQMSSSGPSSYLGGPPQQQQQQPPFNMGNYNAYGPPMGPVGGPGPGPGGYVGPMNPWANGPQQPYNNNPQNYMAPQQQQQQQSQQYNNMYGGAH